VKKSGWQDLNLQQPAPKKERDSEGDGNTENEAGEGDPFPPGAGSVHEARTFYADSFPRAAEAALGAYLRVMADEIAGEFRPAGV
jgi:hypothetical protein